MAGMTLAEKVLAAKAGRASAKPGDILDCKVDVAMAHEACAQAIGPFRQMGAHRIWDTGKVVIALDHWVPASSEQSAGLHKVIREFVKQTGIKHFYDVGNHGICHQMLVEKGHSVPGSLIVGSDSHTNMAGAVGAFATGVGPTEVAAIFALGEVWLKVPESIRVQINGRTGKQVYGKDLVLRTLKDLTIEGAVYKAVEYHGEAVEHLPMWQRFTLTNMTTEMGAKTGIIAPDKETQRYLETLPEPFAGYKPPKASEYQKWVPDEDAIYGETLIVNANGLGPQVAKPWTPDNVVDIEEVEGIHMDQVFVGSCTNSRIEDIRSLCEIIAGEKIATGTRLIVTPASTWTYKQALREGLIDVVVEAGGTFAASSCGACFGGHLGVLASKETCASSTNRNFKGRMGSKEAEVYLMSPASCGAAAVYGEITDPRKMKLKQLPKAVAA